VDRDLLRHWLALTRVKGVDCAVWKSLLEGFGRDPVALFEAARSGAPIDAPPRVAKGLKGFRDWEWVDAELDRAEGYGVRIVTYASPDYPPLLKEIPDPPVLLYARGAGTMMDLIAGRVRDIRVHVRERAIDAGLRGDYENDPVFRQYVQEWVSRMWEEKDERIARLRQLR